jgi:hypothetical protein
LRVECLSLAVLVYGDLEEPLAVRSTFCFVYKILWQFSHFVFVCVQEGALLPASPPITAHLVFDLAKAYLLNHQPHQVYSHLIVEMKIDAIF